MKIENEVWLILKQRYPNCFHSLSHPRSPRRRKVENLSAKLEKIAEKSSDPALVRKMIDCVCVYMLRPIIRHKTDLEFDSLERRKIGDIMQSLSPNDLYPAYSSNKLRKRNLQDAIGIANWYVNDDRPVPKNVWKAKRELERTLDIKNPDHLPLYDLMSFGDKMLIVKKVEIYFMAVIKWCIEHETSLIAKGGTVQPREELVTI